MGIPFGGLANALGLGLQGYGQDQQRRVELARQKLLDSQSAERLGMEHQLHDAQIQNYQSEATARTAATEQARVKGQANFRAYGALQKTAPDHPLVSGGYNEGVDYLGELKNTQEETKKQKMEAAKQRAFYNTLRVEFPKHPLAAQPFDENNPAANADYAAALADAREQRKLGIAGSKQHWVSAGVDKSGMPVILNTETGETKSGGGIRQASGLSADSPQIAATRRDLSDVRSQQIRAEHDVGAAKSDEKTFLANKSKRITLPLGQQMTAADSTFHNQYADLHSAVGNAEQRKKGLTTKADSIQGVIAKLRAGASIPQLLAPSGDAPASAPNAAPMSGLQRVQRAKDENDGFMAAVQNIKSTVTDPAEQQRRIQEAQRIFNQRMMKVNAGVEPDEQ